MKLWYKHNGKRWFRWKLGKLGVSYMGHTTKLGVKYWGELTWNGVCVLKWGRYL